MNPLRLIVGVTVYVFLTSSPIGAQKTLFSELALEVSGSSVFDIIKHSGQFNEDVRGINIASSISNVFPLSKNSEINFGLGYSYSDLLHTSQPIDYQGGVRIRIESDIRIHSIGIPFDYLYFINKNIYVDLRICPMRNFLNIDARFRDLNSGNSNHITEQYGIRKWNIDIRTAVGLNILPASVQLRGGLFFGGLLLTDKLVFFNTVTRRYHYGLFLSSVLR